MNKIKLKPKEGLRVLKPNGEELNKEGELVTNEKFWNRAFRHKSVTLMDHRDQDNKEKK